MSNAFMQLPELPISQARMHEYLDVWAMEPTRSLALAESLRRCDWPVHLAAWRNKQTERADAGGGGRQPFTLTAGGIAVVGISGPMMKQVGSMEDGTSTILVRRQIRAAANSADVKGIMLLVDSPGGTIAGTADLADDIAAATKRKPTATYYQDLGASAAVWVGSQTEYQSANVTAAIGSIGVYTVAHDLSKMADAEGVGVYVIASGKFKGLGVPGTKVSEELLAELQKRVDGLAVHFIAAVARGRNLSTQAVTEIADGRTHAAADAVSLKLIDRVESFDEAMAALERRIGSHSQGRKAMSESNTNAPVAATLAQLEAACPGASSDFFLQQLKAGATVQAAQTACISGLNTQITSLNAKIAELEAAKKTAEEKAAAAEQKLKPVEKGSTGGKHGLREEKIDGTGATETTDDPIAAFNEAVAAKVAGGMNKRSAAAAVCRDEPELHRAYVEAYNAGVQRGGRKGS